MPGREKGRPWVEGDTLGPPRGYWGVGGHGTLPRAVGQGWRCPKLPQTLLSPPKPPTQGQATDIAIQAEEILKLKRQINGLYSKHTGQPLPVIGEVPPEPPVPPSFRWRFP